MIFYCRCHADPESFMLFMQASSIGAALTLMDPTRIDESELILGPDWWPASLWPHKQKLEVIGYFRPVYRGDKLWGYILSRGEP